MERLQWNAKSINYRIKNTVLTHIAINYKGKVDGVVGKNTKIEMQSWINNNYIASGSLISVSINDFSHIALNSTFKKLSHPSVNANEILVDNDMAPYLTIMNSEAKKLGVTISLSQTLRIIGAIISGASYQPASKSQHYIGHAVDCNIIDGDSYNRQIDFKNNKQTENAKKFIKNVTLNGLRWSGNFPADKNGNKDTPHFDKRILPTSKEYDFKYFLINCPFLTNNLSVKFK